MENASKALLMAGGILIALMVVGALMLMFTNLSDYQNKSDASRVSAQIAEFNNQLMPYEKDNLTLMEMKTLYNKLESLKKTTEFSIKNNIEDVYKTENYSIYTSFSDKSITEEDKMNRSFKCTKIDYDSTGRICEMKFVKNK